MQNSQDLESARDPLCRNMDAPLVRNFTVLGMGVHFQTNSEAVLEACVRSFGRNGCPPPGPSRFAIRLVADPALKAGQPWPEAVFRGHGNLFYIAVGPENVAVADLDQGRATAFLSPAMIADAERLRRIFVECLPLTLATHGKSATHTYVHASAVAKGNKGLLLSGPAHEGKSTLAYACARRGFHVVADDAVYLRRSGADMTAWGNPWRLRLSPESLDLFDELQKRRDTLARAFDADVFEIDTAEIFASCPKTSFDPVALIFLDRSGTPCSWHPIDVSEAVRLLDRDLIYDSAEVMEMHRQTWAQLASRGSYILRYGNDVESAVKMLDSDLSP